MAAPPQLLTSPHILWLPQRSFLAEPTVASLGRGVASRAREWGKGKAEARARARASDQVPRGVFPTPTPTHAPTPSPFPRPHARAYIGPDSPQQLLQFRLHFGSPARDEEAAFRRVVGLGRGGGVRGQPVEDTGDDAVAAHEVKFVGALAVGVERGHHDVLQPELGAMQARLHRLFGNA